MVEVRLIGLPDEVAALKERLLRVSDVHLVRSSAPRPSRKAPDKVLQYITVEFLPNLSHSDLLQQQLDTVYDMLFD